MINKVYTLEIKEMPDDYCYHLVGIFTTKSSAEKAGEVEIEQLETAGLSGSHYMVSEVEVEP